MKIFPKVKIKLQKPSYIKLRSYNRKVQYIEIEYDVRYMQNESLMIEYFTPFSQSTCCPLMCLKTVPSGVICLTIVEGIT